MQAHGFALEDGQLTDALHRGVVTAFLEDKAMIESQAAMIAASPPAPMIGLPMDAALTMYRRHYEQALAAERALSWQACDAALASETSRP